MFKITEDGYFLNLGLGLITQLQKLAQDVMIFEVYYSFSANSLENPDVDFFHLKIINFKE